MNSIPTLASLPDELHLQICLNLTTQDRTLIALTSKRFHALYYPGPTILSEEYSLQNDFPPPYSLWVMADVRDDEKDNYRQHADIQQVWLLRTSLAPYLKAWISRVTRDAWQRSKHPDERLDDGEKLELCVGCTRFLKPDVRWMHGKEALTSLSTKDLEVTGGAFAEDDSYREGHRFWDAIEGVICGGKFCPRCVVQWNLWEQDFLSEYADSFWRFG
ncbi:hypothetical protein G7Y79_00076g099250 [Physcia stellaris]|nr:hypothetical protein G7Y79_00076g099250 [Physcia stellaris]